MLPYKLDTTNDLLTARAGLLATAQYNGLPEHALSESISTSLSQKVIVGTRPLNSPRPSSCIRHEGSFHLDEVLHIQDEAPCTVLDMNKLPQATTLGGWIGGLE